MTRKELLEMLGRLSEEDRAKILTLAADLLEDQQLQREAASAAPV